MISELNGNKKEWKSWRKINETWSPIIFDGKKTMMASKLSYCSLAFTIFFTFFFFIFSFIFCHVIWIHYVIILYFGGFLFVPLPLAMRLHFIDGNVNNDNETTNTDGEKEWRRMINVQWEFNNKTDLLLNNMNFYFCLPWTVIWHPLFKINEMNTTKQIACS